MLRSLTAEAAAEVVSLCSGLAARCQRDHRGFVLLPAGAVTLEPLAIPEPELPAALMSSRAGRRWLSAHGLDFFASYYLGLETPWFHREWIRLLHGSENALIEAPRDRGKSTVIGWRDPVWRIAMSSTWIGPDGSQVLGLRPDLVPPNLRVIIATLTAPKAADRLRTIESTLTRNERLLADFGPFQGQGAWGVEVGLLARRTATPEAQRMTSDPTLRCLGIGAGFTGSRADLLVCDDIEDENTTNTDALRRKTRVRIANLQALLDDRAVGQDGRRWTFRKRTSAIGTRKHAADQYSVWEQSPLFRVGIYRAFVRWPGGGTERDETKWKARTSRVPVDPADPTRGYKTQIDGFEHIAPGAEIIGLSTHTVESTLSDYENAKAGPGSWYFLREYQQQMIDDAQAQFPMRWFDAAKAKGRALPLYRTHRYEEGGGVLERLAFPGRAGLGSGLQRFCASPWWRPEDPERERLLIYQAWDLSLVDEAGKQLARDSDYTCGITAGLNWTTGSIALLDVFRARWISEGHIIGAITDHASAWDPIEIAIERNAFARLHVSHLRRTTSLPVHGHHTGANKRDPWIGVPALAGLMETRDGDRDSGRLVLPYSAAPENAGGRELVDLLVSELHGLGTEPHDDMVMTLWILWSLVRRLSDYYQRKLDLGQLRIVDPADRLPPGPGPALPSPP